MCTNPIWDWELMGTYAPTNTLGLTMYQCKFLAACTQMRDSHGTLHTTWRADSGHGRIVRIHNSSTILENFCDICSCKCQLRRRNLLVGRAQIVKKKIQDLKIVFFCQTLSYIVQFSIWSYLDISVKVQIIQSKPGRSHKSTVWSCKVIQNAR